MEPSQEESKTRIKIWTAVEDRVLVESLVTLKLDHCTWRQWVQGRICKSIAIHDGGQATGYGIKATPHITSRLKTLKRLWQTAYDIVYGPNTSGFGWDPETKLILASDDVWEEYLKSVANALAKGLVDAITPLYDNANRVTNVVNDLQKVTSQIVRILALNLRN
ncbi:hypothetical protein K1719_014842 [Acacia pycnantha]|nr:hypothetical protein K1719_014842 [Acacia pycnantha]